MEDRVIDLALAIGGLTNLWRSWSKVPPGRVVRGLIANLFPGQDSISLLVSPEGWLVPLHEISAAEEEAFSGPPTCWVKTQFGSLEGHVALVELLRFLKREFFPDLQVQDEGEYWESRDLKRLHAKRIQMQTMIGEFADQLCMHGLSPEAAEDTNILVHRIERVAEQVHRILKRPLEHPPVDLDGINDANTDLNMKKWEAFYREQRRQQERISRVIDDEMRAGKRPSEALDAALSREMSWDVHDQDEERAAKLDTSDDWGREDSRESEVELGGSWRSATDSMPYVEQDSLDCYGVEPHPLLQMALDFSLQVHLLLERNSLIQSSAAQILRQAIGELRGGLVQGLHCSEATLHSDRRGWAVVQMKRALRGTAFGRGAAFALRGGSHINHSEFEFLNEQFVGFQEEIQKLLATLLPPD